MKRKTIFKSNLLLSAMAATLCCIGGLSVSSLRVSAADGETSTVSAKEYEGFEMSFGAQARQATDGVGGIRFTTNVSKAAYEAIEADYTDYQSITFYTLFSRADKFEELDEISELTVDKVHDTKYSDYVLRMKATNQPDGEGDVSYMATYKTADAANFGKTLMARGLAEVVDKDGNLHYIYAKANDNVRTMKQIAVSAVEDTERISTDAGLEKYFTAQTATAKGYIEQSLNPTELALPLPTLAEEENIVAAFTANERVAFTDGIVTNLTNVTADTLGGEKSVTLYTDKNNAYTVSVMNITKALDSADDLTIFDLSTKDVEGYYLVTRDIDASAEAANTHADLTNNTDSASGGIDWDFDYAFKGVLDGNGHTIIVKTNKGGFFGNLRNATITNVNLVFNVEGSRKTNTDKWPTGLAYSAFNTTISNVYVELNPTADLQAASSRDWALSLVVTAPTLSNPLKTENLVVVNNDKFDELQANTSNTWASGALFYTDLARNSAEEDRDKYMENVFVIAPEKLGNGYYVPMAGGTALQAFASNDKLSEGAEADNNKLTNHLTYANVTRYDDVATFVESFDWEDKIPDFIMQRLLVSGVTAYVGETSLRNNGQIAVPLNEAQEVALKIGERDLTDVVLSCDEDVVEISDNSFALTEVGTATLTATSKLEGMTVCVTFTVSLKSTTHDGKVLFSGMDGEVDMKTVFGEGTVLTNAYDLDGISYEVADNEISGLTNETNDPVEKTLLLGTEDNEWKYVTFTVYTKLLDSADDLAVFSLSTQDVTGCYLVTKDIDASAEAANAHTDLTNNTDHETSGGTDWDFDHAFTGVFDGNGHTVTVNTDKGGLFGYLKNATISNVNFVFNVTGTMKANTDKFPSGLAYGVTGTQATTTISNVYAKLNPAAGLTAASSRTWALSLIVSADKSLKLDGVVVVNNDDFANLKADSTGWVAGALINFHSGRTDTGYTGAHITNVFVVAPERLGVADADGEGNPSENYAYYVPMSGRTASQAFASNDTAGEEAAKTNTGNSTQYTYTGVTRYSNVNAFVDSNAWSGVISDSVMTAVGLDYVTDNQQ